MLAGYDAQSRHQPARYAAFLDDIIAVAQRFGFKPEDSSGRDEPPLRGLREQFSARRPRPVKSGMDCREP